MKKLQLLSYILFFLLSITFVKQADAAIRNLKVTQPDLTITKLTAEPVGQTQDYKYTISIQNSGGELKSLSNIMLDLQFMQGKFSGITTTTRPNITVPLSSLTSKVKLESAETIDVIVTGSPRTKNFATEEKIVVNAKIDSTNVTAESDENNNLKSIEIKPSTSNLAIESVNFTAQNTIQVSIKNKGNLVAPLSDQKGSVILRYNWVKDDGKTIPGGSPTLASFGSGSLGIGATILATIPFAPPEGAKNFDVQISFSSTDILDSNTSDDQKSVPLPGIMPDIKLEEFGKYRAGDTSITQTVTVKNVGKGSLSGSGGNELFMEYVMLDKDSKPIGTAKKEAVELTSSIEPGRGTPSTYRFEVVKDVAKIRFTIDPENKIKETDEGNNSLEIPVAVPDIAIESLSYTGKGNASYSIKNVSQSAFSGSVGGTYSFLTESGTGPASNMPETTITLAPGATVQKTISNPYYAPGGGQKSFQITLQTSALESSKENNTAKVFLFDLQLPPETLVVQDESSVLSAMTGVKQKSVSSVIKKDSQNFIASFIEDVGFGVNDFVKDVQLATTLNPEKKISLHTANAKQTFLEANALVDQGKTKKALGRLKSYENSVEAISDTTSKLNEDNPQIAEKAATVVLTDQVQQQLLFTKFKRLGSADEDKEIDAIRKDVVTHIAETAKVIDSPETIKSVLENGLKRDENAYSALSDVEVIKEISPQLTKSTQDVLADIQEDRADQVKLQFSNLPTEYKKYVASIVEESGYEDQEMEKVFAEYADWDLNVKDLMGDETPELKEDEKYADDETNQEFSDKERSDENPYDSGVAVTSGCPDIDDPVCGKDELNYTNECEAKDNGTEVAHKGKCSTESSIRDDESEEDKDNNDD